MIEVIRTNSQNQDFVSLVKRLDGELAERDKEEHAFYDKFNNIDVIQHVVVLYENQKPLGCGAIKEFDNSTMEVKRMYTIPENRGKGLATKILTELETWALEMSYEGCVLETGKRQPEAIKLYVKNGYMQIPNYGQYTGIDNSVCFKKTLGV
ncbi:GNAT family N-acetyltransferase [Maribacter sp. HTCC2170]|uniref:GNAT family N-acetyltransferase n=1 Tax=Maribacter sp. (strain HTCC2170 / KCCM 42371) TaxID=313603 RepID=UPI00006BD26A|nr:GNAT family N-acetyltransferase [Maribacter sp. HTCC2170]EAR02054.1 predicted acetyltransferase [Maribacter sp. HTCC2170]